MERDTRGSKISCRGGRRRPREVPEQGLPPEHGGHGHGTSQRARAEPRLVAMAGRKIARLQDCRMHLHGMGVEFLGLSGWM